MTQGLILSLLLQAYVVASPFYLQLAIDEAALKGDRDLLTALAIGFGLFAGFNAGAEALRGLALQRVSALLSWSMTQRLFHHMLRLPLPWFQRRKLADALTRFDSLNPIKTLIAGGLVSVTIDGVLSIVTLIFMVAFSPTLSLITLTGFITFVVLRLAAIPLSMKLGMATLSASIAEQGKRIETLRAIQTIKVMAAEPERERDWANKFADVVRASQATEFSNIGFTTAYRLLDSVVLVIIVYFGATFVIGSHMTVGVLYAFLAYRSQFLARAQGLFEQAASWRMLDLYTHRLADLVLHPVEEGIDRSVGNVTPMIGKIELEGVAFRYAPHEPFILRGISLTIEPGEFVAITGPSGVGKSTLLKIICGLYPIVAGEIRIDGKSLSAWGPISIRKNLGVVMQDDELLSGSIADNVAFFDEHIDVERVAACLKAAAIDEEVDNMPMRADTLLGDMGSSLSGGQKQRILLARALYRRPKILVLDEATSHLDVAKEKSINRALASILATRIIVAHRPETIGAADRVIFLDRDGIQMDQRRIAPIIHPASTTTPAALST